MSKSILFDKGTHSLKTLTILCNTFIHYNEKINSDDIFNALIYYKSNFKEDFKKLKKEQKNDVKKELNNYIEKYQNIIKNKYSKTNISRENIIQFKKEMENQNNNILHNVLYNISLKKATPILSKHCNMCYNITVKPKLDGTNQGLSGRCWIFAGLNILRRELCKKLDLKTFELSQSYIYFWHKLESMNSALQQISKNMNISTNSLLYNYFIQKGCADGGYWETFVNLVQKYGILPKSIYQDSYHSLNTTELNIVLHKLLVQTVYELKMNKEDHKKIINKCLCKTYEILCACLGYPSKQFDLNVLDKKGTIIRMKQLTSEYLFQILKFKINDYICVSNDPRYKFNKLYSKKYRESMIGKKSLFLNLDMPRIKELAISSLKKNKAVYVSCDVLNKSKTTSTFSKDYDISNVFSLSNKLDKKNKLIYNMHRKMHAMIITGVNVDSQKNIHGWEVENSWSSQGKNHGYFHIEPDWFDENIYSIIIHKKLLNQKEKMAILNPNIITIDDFK